MYICIKLLFLRIFGSYLKHICVSVCVLFLSNGYSPANLANSSTRVKLAVFGECEYSPKRPFSEMWETRQTRQHSPSRVARTRQTRERRVWQVLRKFSESGESGEFGVCRLDHFINIK